MKFMIAMIGLLTLIAGVLPFLSQFGILPADMISPLIQSIVVIVIGVGGMIYGFTASDF